MATLAARRLWYSLAKQSHRAVSLRHERTDRDFIVEEFRIASSYFEKTKHALRSRERHELKARINEMKKKIEKIM